MNNFILLLFFLGFLSADYGGGYAGSEFKYASNARDLALAGANIANGSDGYLQFSNPALLPQLKSMGISSSFMTLPLDRSIQTISIAKPLPPAAGIALSLYRSATSNIQGRDEMNQFTDNLDVSNYMGMISFGLSPSKRVALGLNLKTFLIQFVDDHSANGIGIDLGLYLKPMDNLDIGLKVENILSELNWKLEVGDEQRSTVESFPLNLGLGFAYNNSKTRLYLQQDVMIVDGEEYFYRTRLGSEKYYGPLIVYLGSYQNRSKLDPHHHKDLVFTGGFGLNMKDGWGFPVQLNYGLDMGRANEGIGHMFTINLRLNEAD